MKVLSKRARGEKPKTSSTYRGVSKRDGKWIAQYKDVRTKIIGYFSTELEAAKAYNEVAKRLGRPFNLLPL